MSRLESWSDGVRLSTWVNLSHTHGSCWRWPDDRRIRSSQNWRRAEGRATVPACRQITAPAPSPSDMASDLSHKPTRLLSIIHTSHLSVWRCLWLLTAGNCLSAVYRRLPRIHKPTNSHTTHRELNCDCLALKSVYWLYIIHDYCLRVLKSTLSLSRTPITVSIVSVISVVSVIVTVLFIITERICHNCVISFDAPCRMRCINICIEIG